MRQDVISVQYIINKREREREKKKLEMASESWSDRIKLLCVHYWVIKNWIIYLALLATTNNSCWVTNKIHNTSTKVFTQQAVNQWVDGS